MTCQDVSRILDSRNVNALSAAERRTCEAHASSCPQCGPDWVVFTRLAAIPTPPMPQQLAALCEARVAAQVGAGGVRRRPNRTILLGTIIVVAAAAAMLVALQMSPLPKAVPLQESIPAVKPVEVFVAPESSPIAGPMPAAAVQPVTVLLVLDQVTGDAIGRDFGHQVHERAREELLALPDVALVDASTARVSAPEFRITYTNLAKSEHGSAARSGGPAATPAAGGQELLVLAELVFKVEALQPSAAGEGEYHPVFISGAPPTCTAPACGNNGGVSPPVTPSTVPDLISVNPGVPLYLPADCIGRRESRCPYTPADIAAYTILSWRLKMTHPDPLLTEKLRAMVMDSSSPPGIWMMAFRGLEKYGKLRVDASGLLADGNMNYDPELRSAMATALIKGGNGAELMRLVQDRLSQVLPSRFIGDIPARAPSGEVRKGLVKLLATELRSDPSALDALASIAANDPDFDVRTEANRALGVEQRSAP